MEGKYICNVCGVLTAYWIDEKEGGVVIDGSCKQCWEGISTTQLSNIERGLVDETARD